MKSIQKFGLFCTAILLAVLSSLADLGLTSWAFWLVVIPAVILLGITAGNLGAAYAE